MTDYRKIALLAVLAALAAPNVALAQTPDSRIIVIGAVNDPAHMRQVADNRDAGIPELAVVYDKATPSASAPAPSPRASPASQAAEPSASTSEANLGQTVKSQ
jgi:hypothetical protein